MNTDNGQTFALFLGLFGLFVVLTSVLIAAQGLAGMIVSLVGGMLLFFVVAGFVFAGIMVAFAVLTWLVARLVATTPADKDAETAA